MHEPNLIGKHHYLLGEDSLLSVLAWVALSCDSVAERCRQVLVNGCTRERGNEPPATKSRRTLRPPNPKLARNCFREQRAS
jgi:hypothetical protein